MFGGNRLKITRFSLVESSIVNPNVLRLSQSRARPKAANVDFISECSLILFSQVKTGSHCLNFVLVIFQTNWSLSTNSEVELFHDIGLLTLDIILKCAFSYRSDCQIKR